MNCCFFRIYIDTVIVSNSCCRWKAIIVDEATPPQELQISAFRGVDLGTKRVLPPP